MCENIEEIIKNIYINSYEHLLCANCDWNIAKKIEKLKRRQNIIFSSEEYKYKYIEFTQWEESKDTILAIGFNPATSDVNKIDSTNKKIIDALKEGYGGYVLLNLYPQVSSSKEEFDEDNPEDTKALKVLKTVLRTILDKKVKVLILWGRTVAIDEELYNILTELIKQDLLYVTVKEGTSQHYHPSRVKIGIMKAEEKTLSPVYSVK